MNDLTKWLGSASTVFTHPEPTFIPNVDDRLSVSVDDFTARIPAWWSVDRADAELALHQLSLPIADSGLVHYAIGWNESGDWRDWVLAYTGLTASGAIVKSGAQVTKSVAGFDIHKFVVGSRDAFLFPIDFTLRVVPKGQQRPRTQAAAPEKPLGDLELRLLLALKDRFDPSRKLNPGVFGAF